MTIPEYIYLNIPMGYRLGPNGEKIPLTKEEGEWSLKTLGPGLRYMVYNSRTHDEDEIGELK